MCIIQQRYSLHNKRAIHSEHGKFSSTMITKQYLSIYSRLFIYDKSFLFSVFPNSSLFLRVKVGFGSQRRTQSRCYLPPIHFFRTSEWSLRFLGELDRFGDGAVVFFLRFRPSRVMFHVGLSQLFVYRFQKVFSYITRSMVQFRFQKLHILSYFKLAVTFRSRQTMQSKWANRILLKWNLIEGWLKAYLNLSNDYSITLDCKLLRD